MKRKNPLEDLKKIKKVDAPPFLYTRIEAKIEAMEAKEVPMKWVLASSFALSFLLFINIISIRSLFANGGNSNSLELIMDDMNLSPANQLYYD